MRLPSIKTIRTKFPDLSKEDVKKVRGILERYCHRPILCLKKINKVIEGHGLEYIEDVNRDDGMEYINMGHSYVATFLYDHHADRIFISCLGEVVEKNPKRFGY